MQPCVTYNNVHTVEYYNERVYELEKEGWDPLVRSPDEAKEKLLKAISKAMKSDGRIPIGVILR